MRRWILAISLVSVSSAGHLAAQAPATKPSQPSTPPANNAAPNAAAKLAVGSDELDVAAQMIKDGRIEEALKKIEEAVKKNPALSPPKLILARIIYQTNPAQARPFLEAAAAATPDHPDIYLTFGDIAQNEGRLTETILNANKVLELVNTSTMPAPQKLSTQKMARILLAGAYEQRRDWNNARTQLLAWLEIEPKNGIARDRYAAVLFNLDKPDEALKEYQIAAKDEPNLLPADVQMARQFAIRGDDARTIQHFEKAMQAAGNSARAHIAYADYLLQKSQLPGAKLHIETAAKLEPQNPLVKQMQGLLARLTRDYPTAERIFQELYQASPANVNASNQLALLLAESGDAASRKRGLEIAESNARQFGQSPELLATLAYSYYRNGNPDQARKILEAILGAVRTPPPDTAYFTALVLADTPADNDLAKEVVKKALESTGLFFYRKEAQGLYDRLEKAKPTEKPKGG